jgi:DUF4097 and DUF4098 domain-containing protein YvlB
MLDKITRANETGETKMTRLSFLIPCIALFLNACSVHIDHDANLRTERETVNFDIDGTAEAYLLGITGVIEVQAGASPSLRVELEYTSGDRPELDVRVENGVLTAEYDCPSDHRGFRYVCSASFYAVLPADSPLWISNTTGRVSVQGMSADLVAENTTGDLVVLDHTGLVNARVTTGNMDLAQVSGDVELDLTTGDIDASDIDAERFDATLTTGHIRLGLVRAADRVSLVVTTGRVQLELPAGSYDLDLATTSGQVQTSNVIDDPGSEHWVMVRNTTGNINVLGR